MNFFKKNKHFNLLKEFSRNEKFYELFKANHGLAFYYFSTGNHFNLKKEILYKDLLNKNQKEIGHALGFKSFEVSLLKKISKDMLSEYLIRMLIDLVRKGQYGKIFSHLKQITLITVYFLSDLYRKNSKAIPSISFLDDQHSIYGNDFRLCFIFDDRLNFLEFERRYLHGFEMFIKVHERFPFVRFKRMNHFFKFQDKLEDEIWKNSPKKIFQEPSIPWQGNLFIQPILNDAILYEEGCVQKHCCFDFAKDIEKGNYFFFKVLYPMRATLAIMKEGKYWIFSEIKAKRNRRVSEKTWQFVKSWLDDNNIYY
ncbi:hypothetical protein ND861_04855 [Leptospira sp. 2 VSF19]|uniref:Uncharacterized protein n=1 Tax=Leptospira soteropolitanensis TaxID=2950025 RepID=A0AAW5VEJ3_9LEPT|nr:hypothetical protein [Leptospira soteropolitanensis]MCW7491980.1 hypothetical protein [Leptospira soteropolitanensis]MCW7499563.1 hypothetical protein [Leptospira soteropolitanensis]MCW7521814.1 hypothetical protein [Leptospira soteropolitanensis]MCW7525667.1 hypothetical protein [Leptospira soteropolitanensis]MCW7530218.1 hypothetical protein [Leptospira soteropolitanensis]